MATQEDVKPKPRCSFCNKSQDAVAVLIASPSDVEPKAYICDECVAVCESILEERNERISQDVTV